MKTKVIIGNKIPDLISSPFCLFVLQFISPLSTKQEPRLTLVCYMAGVIATFVGVVLACTGCYLYQRRKKKLRIVRSTLLSRSISADDSSVDVEKGRNLFGIHLFTYAELEEATSYFDSAKELGDGGFGTVYYGTIQKANMIFFL